MDIMDEIKDLQQQKQVQTNNHKLTYDEYNKAIANRIQRIYGELFMLFHELANNQPQRKVKEIDKVLQDFSLIQLHELHEQLKTAFY